MLSNRSAGRATRNWGSHCKGYPYVRFCEFPGWADAARGAFANDHILYLHEDYTVTNGVHPNEHVVFDAVTEEWREFCKRRLNFRIPAASGHTLQG